MAIQSSVNALMQQLYTIGAIGAGLKEQKKQTKAAVASAPSFEERFRKRYNIDDKTPLTLEQQSAVHWAAYEEGKVGHLISPEAAMRRVRTTPIPDEERSELLEYLREGNDTVDSAIEAQAAKPELQNEVAGKVARASVEARTASINKTKSNFDEHTASLIKYYSKGSGNP